MEIDCRYCNGKKTIVIIVETRTGGYEKVVTCTACNGSGKETIEDE